MEARDVRTIIAALFLAFVSAIVIGPHLVPGSDQPSPEERFSDADFDRAAMLHLRHRCGLPSRLDTTYLRGADQLDDARRQGMIVIHTRGRELGLDATYIAGDDFCRRLITRRLEALVEGRLSE